MDRLGYDYLWPTARSGRAYGYHQNTPGPPTNMTGGSRPMKIPKQSPTPAIKSLADLAAALATPRAGRT